MPLNMEGIMATAKANIGNGSKLINGDAIAAQAQQELVSCMNTAIASSLFGNEMSAVGSASAGGVSKLSDTTYEIGVSISPQFRPSLFPERYGGVDDMAALFNNGYAAGRQVVKYDSDGNFVGASRQYRLPSLFVQTGLAMFQVSGGSDYQVISVQPSGRFGG